MGMVSVGTIRLPRTESPQNQASRVKWFGELPIVGAAPAQKDKKLLEAYPTGSRLFVSGLGVARTSLEQGNSSGFHFVVFGDRERSLFEIEVCLGLLNRAIATLLAGRQTPLG